MTHPFASSRCALVLTLAAVAGCLAGCHSSFTSAPPRGFVRLDEQSAYDFRAASPEGVVLAVRQLPHDPEGSLSFWSGAAENAMRQRGGYALLETRELTIAGGWPAKQLRFGHDEGDRPHLYYLTVVATAGAIYLLEAGGEKPLLERHAAEVDAWIAHFRAERCAPFPFSFACNQLEGKPKAAPAASN